MAKSCRCDTPDSGANVADPDPDVCHTCRGDSSDEMSFIAFFPPVLRPFAQILSTSAYKIACGKAVRALLDDLPTGEETPRTKPYTLILLLDGLFKGQKPLNLQPSNPSAFQPFNPSTLEP